MDRLRGKWYKAANGYDVYEFFEGEGYLLPQLASLLEQRFGFTPQTRLIVCLDGDALIQYEHFSLNWDNWSGLFLLADSQEGNRVLYEIAAMVESLVNDLTGLARDDRKREEMQTKIEALIRDSEDDEASAQKWKHAAKAMRSSVEANRHTSCVQEPKYVWNTTTKEYTMRKNPLVKRIRFVIFVVAMTIIVAIVALLGLIFAPTLLAQVQGKVTIQTFQQGPITRSYRVYRPSSVLPHPGLVLMLTGALGTGFVQEASSGFDAQADRLHWLVVYPDPVTSSDGWDAYGCCSHTGADDIAFFSQIIDHLKVTDKVDSHRVYVAGMSRGAMMAYKVACELSAKIAAAVAVEGNMADQNGSAQGANCHPGQPVSLLALHGTADREVPIGGGRSLVGQESISYASLNDVMAVWRALDTCGSHASVQVSGTLTTTTWSCQGGSTVAMKVIAGGVHSWPGTPAGLLVGMIVGGLPALGPEASLDASRVIADFFEAHTLV